MLVVMSNAGPHFSPLFSITPSWVPLTRAPSYVIFLKYCIISLNRSGFYIFHYVEYPLMKSIDYICLSIPYQSCYSITYKLFNRSISNSTASLHLFVSECSSHSSTIIMIGYFFKLNVCKSLVHIVFKYLLLQ